MLSIALVALSSSRARGQDDAAIVYPRFTLAQLRSDFDQLRTLINTRHPRIFSDRAALDAAFAAERDELQEGMDELALFHLLSPLVSQVNCGHTSLSLSDATDRSTKPQRRYVPLVIQIIEGRLYVTGAMPEQSHLRGREVVQINELLAADIIERLLNVIPADGMNRTRKIKFINRGFGAYFHLHLDAATTFDVELRSSDGDESTTVTLAGIDPAAWDQLRSPAAGGDAEITQSSFADDHARLWVRTFNLYDGGGMQRFRESIDAFFAEVARRRSPNVILDLRGNGGGEPRLGAYLLSYLLAEPVIYFAADAGFYPTLRVPITPAVQAYTGPLYVLVDGDVFSTTGHLVSLLKHHRIGLLIGEETGGSFSCTANNATAILSHSRLRLSFATSTFTTAVDGLPVGSGVPPDKEVDSDVDDVLAGRDAILARALEHIGGEAEPPVIVAHPFTQQVMLSTPVSLVVRAEGKGLLYQWRRDSVPLTELGANNAMFTIPSFRPSDVGAYDVVITHATGSVTSAPAHLHVGAGTSGRLVNLSSRGELMAPGDVLAAGFVIPGQNARSILLRGLGPALAPLGVDHPLPDPKLTLFRGSEPLATSTGWQNADADRIRAESARVGAFPLPEDGRDGVLLERLSPGNYTVHLSSRSGDRGTGLIEIYDASASDDGRTLVNLSTLARLPGSSAPLISGLVVAGDAPQTVLLRAIGPSLDSHGVGGPLLVPRLTLYAGSAAVRTGQPYVNAPERERVQALASTVGAFDLAPEAADQVLVATLQPGPYTIVAQSDAPGWILTEVYAVPLAALE